jgi:heme exporter protein D
MRLWVAYGLIAVMLAAAVACIAYVRHNRPDRKYLRQREREDQRSRDRAEAANTQD